MPSKQELLDKFQRAMAVLEMSIGAHENYGGHIAKFEKRFNFQYVIHVQDTLDRPATPARLQEIAAYVRSHLHQNGVPEFKRMGKKGESEKVTSGADYAVLPESKQIQITLHTE